MKMTKLTYTNRLAYDYKNIENLLEKMSLKGWKCTRFGGLCIHYEKIESQALKYNIFFIPSLSQFDGTPLEKQEILISMCEETGWEYICQWGKMMVFCSSEKNPTPIETDENIKLESIHKSMKKEYLPTLIGMIFLLVISIYATYKDIYIRPEEFFGGFGMFHMPMIGLLGITQITLIVQYILWYKSSKKSVEHGGSCTKPVKVSFVINTCVVSIFVLYMTYLYQSGDKLLLFSVFPALLNLGMVFTIISWLRKKDFDTNLKRLIYFGLSIIIPSVISIIIFNFAYFNFIDFDNSNENEIFYLDKSSIEYEENYYDGGKTFLLEWGKYNVKSTEEYREFSYSIYKSDYSFVNEIVLNSTLELYDYEIEQGAYWNKIFESDDFSVWDKYKVYENLSHDFVVRTDKGILNFSSSPIFSNLEIELAIKMILQELEI